MGLSGKNASEVTPAKNPQVNRSKTSENGKDSENCNPNHASPGSRFPKSSEIKSVVKTQKSASKIPKPSPRNKIRERKFVVAKRNSKKGKAISTTIVCKCKEKGFTSQKCLCVAYDSLRASQEEFFKNLGSRADGGFGEIDEENNSLGQTLEIANGYEGKSEEFDYLGTTEVIESDPNENNPPGIMGSSTIKRRRDKLLEEARQSVPYAESGIVMHLVKAFERLLTIPKESDKNDERGLEDDDKKGMKWALPGQQPKVPETQISLYSFSPSDFFITSENLGLDSRVSSSSDSCHESFTISSRIFGRGQRSQCNISESSGMYGGSRCKKRQPKATSQKPFKLRTEQRGRNKGEEFIKKLRQMIMEEEKQRIPVAQGLPWTTDEPECLLKPPIKKITRPIDLVLHSDVRAMERAEFDQQMAEKMSLIEQYREERERQQKLAAEEEIKRLRKELVPRAQPLPYFDRPFIPRRSLKHPTIPKHPKFHILQHKRIKCCMSWNDMHSNNEMH